VTGLNGIGYFVIEMTLTDEKYSSGTISQPRGYIHHIAGLGV